MQAKRQVSGLGNANRRRRTTEVNRGTWQSKRLSFFQHNVRLAASAKATRTAYDVTQWEMAEVFSVSTSAVACWESGKYSWPGGQKELHEYIQVVIQLAQGR